MDVSQSVSVWHHRRCLRFGAAHRVLELARRRLIIAGDLVFLPTLLLRILRHRKIHRPNFQVRRINFGSALLVAAKTLRRALVSHNKKSVNDGATQHETEADLFFRPSWPRQHDSAAEKQADNQDRKTHNEQEKSE